MKRAIAAHRANPQLGIGAVNTDTGPPVKRPKLSDEVTGSLSSYSFCFFWSTWAYMTDHIVFFGGPSSCHTQVTAGATNIVDHFGGAPSGHGFGLGVPC